LAAIASAAAEGLAEVIASAVGDSVVGALADLAAAADSGAGDEIKVLN
jgi:hypothetical protein